MYSEIKYEHTNSINKLKATGIYHYFSLKHCKQTKSNQNALIHKNKNQVLRQHSSPFNVIQVS